MSGDCLQNVRVIPGGAEQDDLAYMIGPDGVPRAMDGTPLPTGSIAFLYILGV